MKKLNILFLLFFVSVNIFSQVFIKSWDARYGCNYTEHTQLLPLDSNGYILAGSMISTNCGDISQPNYDSTLSTYDFWIIRIDKNGNKLWDNHYGGVGDDFLTSIIKTPDNGFLLGGISKSFLSYDVSFPPLGQSDFWIIKIDSVGNKIWDGRYGGSKNEELNQIVESDNSTYYLIGNSYSPISPSKTQNNYDSTLLTGDFWVVKIDSSGNKIWDRTFGGNMEDFGTCGVISSGSGLIVGGYSWSSSYGNKTDPNIDSTLTYPDYWILRIDSSGNIIWDRTFGGTGSDEASAIIQTNDGNYIIGGVTDSDIGFDIVDSSRGGSDYWILKFDLSGNKIWTHRYGGPGYDGLLQLANSKDNLLLSGDSESNSGFDKSENNMGSQQGWVIEVDSNGAKRWDKTLFTPGFGFNGSAYPTDSGCFIFANATSGSSGGYKSQNNYGFGFNFWIVKLCDSTFNTSIFIPSIPKN